MDVMAGVPGEELLRRPVLVRGIELGRAVDVILDAEGERVLGFDVLCGDGRHRFLPLAAVEASPGRIDVRSALTLLDDGQLAFYRERGSSLNELRGDGNGAARRGDTPGS